MMMEELTYIVLVLQMVILGFQLFILHRIVYGPIKKGQVTSSDAILIKSIIDDFASKLTLRDEKIAELMVRLEVLEEKMKTRPLEVTVKEEKVTERLPEKPPPSRDLTRQILELLSKNSMTSTEVQKIIKRSREHVARLLKSLYEQGLVTRDSSKKPFKYTITEEGRKVLSSSS